MLAPEEGAIVLSFLVNVFTFRLSFMLPLIAHMLEGGMKATHHSRKACPERVQPRSVHISHNSRDRDEPPAVATFVPEQAIEEVHVELDFVD